MKKSVCYLGILCGVVVALAPLVARAGKVATSEKSYFIDTRKPVVELSRSVHLNTYHHGMLFIVR